LFSNRKSLKDVDSNSPELIKETVLLTMNDKQRDIYDSLQKQCLYELETGEIKTEENQLTLATRLLQVSADPRLIGLASDHSVKNS
jgi:SNF2 family DNA or RNA helicase